METSDENFAWTDASSDCSKDTDMVVDMKRSKSKRSSDRGETNKNESHVEPETVQDEKKHREKKRKKHAIYNDIENANSHHQINECIKSEPNSASGDHGDTLHEAEDYLNLRVKQEQAAFVEPTPMKTKKKKNHKQPKENEGQELELSAASRHDVDIDEHHVDSSYLHHSEISEIDIGNRKKKKKKKEKLSMEYDTSEILEDSDDSHRTKKKKKKKNKELLQGDNFQHDEEKSQIASSNILSSTLIQENGSIQENGREQYSSDASTLASGTRASTHKSKKIEVSVQKAGRISDRIRFEEDSVDYEPKEDTPKHDLQLQHFISSNVHLKPLQDLPGDPEISEDDEVWIFKVPHDISVGHLENTNLTLTLDGKKKLKINGNSYDTNMDTTVSAAPILIYNKRKAFIKNIPLKGVIHLRKRIPKIHIPYESLTMSNESSFIPLPGTKSRHPLFGARYEWAARVRAARVPPAAAERTSVPLHGDSAKRKKRKQKVEACSDIDVKPNLEELHSHRKKRKREEKLKMESDSEAKPSTEVLCCKNNKRKSKERLEFESDGEAQPSIEVHSKKKKKKNKRRLETESDIEMKLRTEASHSKQKKRKHSDEKGTSRKAKRVKYDPSSADAWESERAIEKNLFDF